MGEKLADKLRREHPDHDIDVVIPIPDTSRTCALQLAQKLGINDLYFPEYFLIPILGLQGNPLVVIS